MRPGPSGVIASCCACSLPLAISRYLVSRTLERAGEAAELGQDAALHRAVVSTTHRTLG
jgi:hypothetical protein